jgi:hypothetical protein
MVGEDIQQERAANGDGSDKEGEDGKGDGDGNEGAGQQRWQERHGPWRWQRWWRATKRAMVTAARSMATRVAGKATGTRAMATEGKQQSTINGINKGGGWLARERQWGNHTTTAVGNDEQW